ncbi:hypothetical protein [Chitinophaga niastensis]|uniref:hypothetical protein n=1 Tax=Chitinophaga niastensis TaxID=536980 RepID=UPI0011B1C8BE|nr:hypothetical protein [Chitinophaga niastensis]
MPCSYTVSTALSEAGKYAHSFTQKQLSVIKKVSKKLSLRKIKLSRIQLTNLEAIQGARGLVTSSIQICDGCGGNSTISCGGSWLSL